MRLAIVGFGRAGKIHFESSESAFDVVAVCDKRNSIQDLTVTARDVDAVLAREDVDAVVIATPSRTHFDLCLRALEAGKHVFCEKPLAQNAAEIERLYAEAASRGLVLFTALNRRYDARWRKVGGALRGKKVLHVNVVCRDHPFPPAAYLEGCGGILRDAAIHDIDILMELLDDTPVEVTASLDERGETSSVLMHFSRGCQARLVHSRHSEFYDQRVEAVHEEGMVEMAPDRTPGLTFAERYSDSYVAQMRDFRLCIERQQNNVPLATALLLDRVLDAAERSARDGVPVALQTLRAYEAAQSRVRRLYEEGRAQTVESVARLLATHAPGQRGTRTVWEVLDELGGFVDLSDPDVDVPNAQHALQTAESVRRAGLPEWMQLTGLIHDFGKLLYKWGCDEDGTSLATQWALVGDTYVVGHPQPEALVYPEFNRPVSTVYPEGVGLDACAVSFGHDEYLYRVLLASETRLPEVALKIVRYHSLYAWHERDAYAELENRDDKLVKGWVKLFNTHDLYSKRHRVVNIEAVRTHYDRITSIYLPNGLRF
jgi:inositol oxygenase